MTNEIRNPNDAGDSSLVIGHWSFIRHSGLVICHSRRGFVLLTALATFMIVSVALLALASAMTGDARHTLDRACHSQLDQLLLAGANDAVDHLSRAVPKAGDAWTIKLPDSVAEQGATLSSSVDSSSDLTSGKLTLHIEARIGNHSAEQIVEMKKIAKGWQIVRAEIPWE